MYSTIRTLFAFIILTALQVMAQAPASGYPPGYIGPYTRLGTMNEASFIDGGAQLQGALIFGTDAGLPYIYNGSYWQNIPTSTTTDMTLYVDADGGTDLGLCTSTGTGACATVGAALKRVPRNVRHNVTVNVAAGTYAEALNYGGFYIDNGITLSVVGGLSAVAPTTGTASGTTTAASAPSSAGPATITDSGQTWTVDNLKGRFITFGSGTFSGQTFPISGNTATTVTFAGAASAGVGVTYSIVTPNVIFAQPTGGTIANVDGRGAFGLTSVDVTATATSGLIFRGPTGALNLTTARIITSSSVTTLSVQLGRVTLNRSIVQNTGTGGGMVVSGSSGYVLPSVDASRSFFRNAGTPAAFQITRGAQTATYDTLIAETTNGTAFSLITPFFGFSTPFYATCTTVGSGEGVTVGSLTTSGSTPLASSAIVGGNARITGCGVGVKVNAQSSAVVGALAFDNVTTALQVVEGGQLNLKGATPTFTSVTNELSLDGTVYPFSFLTGLPSPQVINNSYGSTIIR